MERQRLQSRPRGHQPACLVARHRKDLSDAATLLRSGKHRRVCSCGELQYRREKRRRHGGVGSAQCVGRPLDGRVVGGDCRSEGAATGDTAAAEYRRLFENGRRWIDANLFNGEYYIQQIRGVAKDKIAASLLSTMGSEDTEKPQYQVGAGCLLDQLVGQYMAEVAGLGPLVSPANIRRTLESIYRYNYKRTLTGHNTVQRTYALNDEAALVICDYGKAERPRIPFPYYAEAWTGLEYLAAAHMIYAGMTAQGVECVSNARGRHDGEKRNPWNEPECGHHYARAMSAWSTLLAISGFRYYGGERAIAIKAPAGHRCFWSTATAWGAFHVAPAGVTRSEERRV